MAKTLEDRMDAAEEDLIEQGTAITELVQYRELVAKLADARIKALEDDKLEKDKLIARMQGVMWFIGGLLTLAGLVVAWLSYKGGAP